MAESILCLLRWLAPHSMMMNEEKKHQQHKKKIRNDPTQPTNFVYGELDVDANSIIVFAVNEMKP